MKRSKLLLSSLCLALVLMLTVAPSTKVFASDGPQGGSNSTTSAPPPPPPPPTTTKTADLLKILEWIFGLLN